MDLTKMSQQIGDGAYIQWWQSLFSTILFGFWGKTLAVVALALACWFGVRARNLGMMFLCLLMAALLAYGAPILRSIGFF